VPVAKYRDRTGNHTAENLVYLADFLNDEERLMSAVSGANSGVVNKVILIGHVVNEPEIRYISKTDDYL